MTNAPETTAAQVREWCEQGIVNIVGGCCGTTPAHIRAIADDGPPAIRRAAIPDARAPAPASPASSR